MVIVERRLGSPFVIENKSQEKTAIPNTTILFFVAVVLMAFGFQEALLAAQFLAGGCWGAASVAAYSAVVSFGRTGREGKFLGFLFAVFTLAAFVRIAILDAPCWCGRRNRALA